MKQDIRILYLEDEPADAVIVNHELRKAGLNFRTQRVETRDGFLAGLTEEPPDIILSDHGLRAFDGFSALAIARDRCPETPFIFVTDSLGEEMTIETFASGATDYVLKRKLSRLAPVIQRALDVAKDRALLRQKQQELSESEAQKDAILQTALDAIILMNHRGVLQEWNPAAERIFGYSRAEVVGRQLAELIVPPALRESHREGLQRYLGTGESHILGQRLEMTALHANGTEFPAELTVVRVPGSEPPLFIGYLRDIAERRQANQELRRLNAALEHRIAQRNARLKEISQELDMFSHSMSHDFSAPLRLISSFVKVLQRESTWRLDPKSRRHLESIASSTQRARKLLDALLAFSRIGHTEMRLYPVKLADLVEDARRQLAPEIKGRRIDWSIGELPEVLGDPGLLFHAVFQLLSNAVKYTRPRKRARIEIDACATEPEPVISVRDNGVGFDMRHAHKLFGVFQRLHLPEQFEGTGIGLANVRRVIQRHGGRTWAEGAVDGGATFYFSMPPA